MKITIPVYYDNEVRYADFDCDTESVMVMQQQIKQRDKEVTHMLSFLLGFLAASLIISLLQYVLLFS